MDLAELLDEQVVKVPLEGLDKEEVIAELLELLVRAGHISDRPAALEALYERERKGSTGIGGGVAIPHAQSPEVKGVVVSAGVSRDGVEFEALDEKPVHVVFLVLAERHNPGPNVQVLAEIGNLMQIPGVYDKIAEADSASQIIEVVNLAGQEQ